MYWHPPRLFFFVNRFFSPPSTCTKFRGDFDGLGPWRAAISKKNNLGSKKIIWPGHFFRFSYFCDRVPPRLPPHLLTHTSFFGPPPQCILPQIVPFDLGNRQIPPRRIRFRGLQLPTRPAKALKIQFFRLRRASQSPFLLNLLRSTKPNQRSD